VLLASGRRVRRATRHGESSMEGLTSSHASWYTGEVRLCLGELRRFSGSHGLGCSPAARKNGQDEAVLRDRKFRE
jgi:hypothetical protein